MAFAQEFAADGIRVNAISAGLFFTETIRSELSADVVERVVGTQLVKREGEPSDIVDALLFPASSKSTLITGETLKVTGGAGIAL